MSTTSRRLRFRFQGRAVLLLTAAWVMLWGDPSLLTIGFGALLAWVITVVFWLAPIRYYGRVHLWRALVLLLVQLRELAVASVQLSVVAFRPRMRLKPGIIRVDLRSNNDLYQVAVAQLISIVPGTLVVEISRRPRVLWLHVFDLPDPDSIEHQRQHALAIEERLVRAFGSAADIEAVRK